MKVYITADTHFNHKNIIKYCNRPFKTVDEMNSAIIANWNNTVSNDDLIIHLGDVALGSREKARTLINSLNGRKILIMGNHDNFRENQYKEIGFKEVYKFPIIWNNHFILSHAPLHLDKNSQFFNIYGHIHNHDNELAKYNSKCVCVERTNYKPLFLYDTITKEYGEDFI